MNPIFALMVADPSHKEGKFLGVFTTIEDAVFVANEVYRSWWEVIDLSRVEVVRYGPTNRRIGPWTSKTYSD